MRGRAVDLGDGSARIRNQALCRCITEIRQVLKTTTFSRLLLVTTLTAGVAVAQSTTGAGDALIAPLAGKSLLLDVAAGDDGFVAVGERGHILVSDARIDNWRQLRAPTRATLTAVAFHEKRLGLAVGHDAVILRTDDGGRTWRRVHFAPEEERPLLDVWFHDERRALAVGAYGYYLESSDGGMTWQPRIIKSRIAGEDQTNSAESEDEEPDDDLHLNQIKRSDTGRFYMAAEAGNVYRSDDEGANWLRLPSPYEGSFFGVLPLTDDSLLLFGLQGRLFRSEDAGLSWKRIDTGTRAALADGIRMRDGTIVVVGYSGTVLVSNDDGRSFKLRQQSNRAAIATLRELANGDLLLVGEGGARRLPIDAFKTRP